MMKNLLELIQITGKPTRGLDTLVRRTLKASEECGELAEAVLSVTSDRNAKTKSHHDIIEEAVDLAITALDIALTKSSDGITESQQREHVIEIFVLKLQKWENKILLGETVVTPNTDKMERMPPAPEERVGALQDTVHHENGRSRAGRASRHRSKRDGA